MNDQRGSWYLVTGLIIGAFIGLALATFVIPVRSIDTNPATLKSRDRQDYRALIAQTFLVEADNGRAIARLLLLQDANPKDALLAQSQRELRENGKTDRGRALAVLAAAVSQDAIVITPLPRQATATTQPGAFIEPIATQEPLPLVPEAPPVSEVGDSVSPTQTPAITETLQIQPSATPQPTIEVAYKLVEQKEICDSSQTAPLIRVLVFNSEGEPVPAVRVEVSVTNGGAVSFFTGFFPRISPGYADYAMVDGMTYNLRVGDSGELVQDLSAPKCRNGNGTSFPGSVQLTFRQP